VGQNHANSKYFKKPKNTPFFQMPTEVRQLVNEVAIKASGFGIFAKQKWL